MLFSKILRKIKENPELFNLGDLAKGMGMILVPTNFGSQATHALAYAVAIAKQQKAKIIIHHSYEINIPPGSNLAFYKQAIHDTEQASIDKLNNFIMPYKQELYHGTTEKLIFELSYSQGLAVKDMERVVKQKQVSLVVAPFRNTTGLMKTFSQGSVMSINQKVKCPVLLVPPNTHYQQIENIVYAIKLDNEKEASSINTLMNFASHFDAKVQCLHILTQGNNKNEVISKIEALKKNILDNDKLTFLLEVFDDVVQGLELFIAKESPDMLVMHFHKQTILKKILSASKIHTILSQNSVPVLLLKE